MEINEEVYNELMRFIDLNFDYSEKGKRIIYAVDLEKKLDKLLAK